MRRERFRFVPTMAKSDLKWKQLTKKEKFIFCFERPAGHIWRELLILCWKAAVHLRRNEGETQMPLDSHHATALFRCAHLHAV